jgi:hypothetical protein
MTAKKTAKKHGRNGKLEHVPISPNGSGRPKLEHVPISDEIIMRPLSEIRPSPENDELYKPVDLKDPEFLGLVESIRRAKRVREPLLITIDGYIVSGHRRYAGAKKVGLKTVPCRTVEIYHNDPRFLPLLRDCNRQRVKTLDEVMREEVVSADPEEAHRRLREYREQQARVDVDTIALGSTKHRASITAAKRPLLDAILDIVKQTQNVGKLSVRQIFYLLLNVNPPPRVHAAKADSVYRNHPSCYKAVDELTVRARLKGLIPFEAIHDPTRPVITWNAFHDATPFIRAQFDGFLKGFYRDLLQSQPNHIEIIGEKNTVGGIIRPVAMDYVIPYTIGRGYSSLPPRHDMALRFKRSGKEKLILLVLCDFDPEGEDIGRSFAQSMRDDFGIGNIVPIKVALTGEQVEKLNLPPNLTAKKKSSRRKGFVERHGENVFELEAIPPATLQQYLRDAIDTVIDVNALNAEIEREKQDAAFLDTMRRQAHTMLGDLGTSGAPA